MKTLPQNLQKIIDDYKNNLQNFISEHNLDSELISDIDERIYEKISEIKNPKPSDIASILAEVWTPEEIFAEELQENTIANNSNNEKQKNIFQKFSEATNKIIFLGTFFELSKLTNISANIFRTLFLIIVFLGFFSGSLEISILAIFVYFLGFLLLRTRFFGFLFSLGIWTFFIFLLIPAIILLGMYVMDFHIGNIYPFMNIPVLFPIGMIIGIFSLILFILYFFRYAFTKKFFGVGFLVTAIVSFVIAVSIGISLVFNLTFQFYRPEHIKREFVIETPKNIWIFAPYELSSGFYSDYYESNIFGIAFWNAFSYRADIDVSPDDNIHLYTLEEYIGLPWGENAYMLEWFDLQEHIARKVIVKSGEWKFPLGFKSITIEKILIPKNMVFANISTSNRWMNNNYKNISFPGMENFSEKERIMIVKHCGSYYYDDNANIHCSITEEDIKSILKYANGASVLE